MLSFLSFFFVPFLFFPFSAGYAIVAGLQSTSVTRLTNTWEKLNKKTRQKHEFLTHLFDIEEDHKAYRDAFSQSSPPAIPYLGLFRRLILSLEETEKVFGEDQEILLRVFCLFFFFFVFFFLFYFYFYFYFYFVCFIFFFYLFFLSFLFLFQFKKKNSGRLSTLWMIVHEIRQYQKSRYSFSSNVEVVSWLLESSPLPEEKCYDLVFLSLFFFPFFFFFSFFFFFFFSLFSLFLFFLFFVFLFFSFSLSLFLLTTKFLTIFFSR